MFSQSICYVDEAILNNLYKERTVLISHTKVLMMRINKRISQKHKATSLDHAIELTEEYAEQHRMPSKRIAELMGVEYKTYRRWMLEGTLPLNRLVTLEHIVGAQFISEYLCVFQGNKVVIDIARGKKSDVVDIAELQAQIAQATACLAQFYAGKASADDTIAELTASITALAYQRENVRKVETPELLLGESDE